MGRSAQGGDGVPFAASPSTHDFPQKSRPSGRATIGMLRWSARKVNGVLSERQQSPCAAGTIAEAPAVRVPRRVEPLSHSSRESYPWMA